MMETCVDNHEIVACTSPAHPVVLITCNSPFASFLLFIYSASALSVAEPYGRVISTAEALLMGVHLRPTRQ